MFLFSFSSFSLQKRWYHVCVNVGKQRDSGDDGSASTSSDTSSSSSSSSLSSSSSSSSSDCAVLFVDGRRVAARPLANGLALSDKAHPSISGGGGGGGGGSVGDVGFDGAGVNHIGGMSTNSSGDGATGKGGVGSDGGGGRSCGVVAPYLKAYLGRLNMHVASSITHVAPVNLFLSYLCSCYQTLTLAPFFLST
jgi:hypothetical protein